MDPALQVVVRAGNQGIHDTSSAKRKRAVKGKRFAWSDEDRFRIGKMAHELKSNKAALKEARLIFPNANESTVRTFKKAYIVAIWANPALSFAIFCTEDAHRVVRAEVLKHMARVWDEDF